MKGKKIPGIQSIKMLQSTSFDPNDLIDLQSVVSSYYHIISELFFPFMENVTVIGPQ